MRSLVMALVVAGLVAIAMPAAARSVQKNDCESVAAWAQSCLPFAVNIAMDFLPHVVSLEQGKIGLTMEAKDPAKLLGVAVQLGQQQITEGVRSIDVLNRPLACLCLKIVDDAPAPPTE